MTKLTIGIPVYNVSKEYLKECLNSVFNNISSETEVIMIDDCSTIDYSDIIQSFKYENFVCEKACKNSGVSVARNRIISIARGEWICFLDGDDILSPYFMEEIDKYLDLKSDVVFFKYQKFKNENSINKENCNDFNVIYPETDEIYELSRDIILNKPTFLMKDVLAGVIGKIFRTSYLRQNQIMFVEGMRKSEDTMFLSKVLYRQPSLAVGSEVMYYYRENELSVCHKYNSQIWDISKNNLEIIKEYILSRYGDNILEEFYKYKVTSAIIDILMIDILHKDNPATYFKRKVMFQNLINDTEYKNAIIKIEPEKCEWAERRLLLFLIKKKDFFLLNFVNKHPIIYKIYGKWNAIRKRKK